MKPSLLLASPQFGGQCYSIFTMSAMALAGICAKQDIPFDSCLFWNESLVTRARNYCMDYFQRSSATHMMFVDADIGFHPGDVLELMRLSVEQPQYEIIGGMYKRKAIGGGYAFDNKTKIDMAATEPQEVDGIGTGFMLISRPVLAKFSEAFPQYRYVTEKDPGAGIEGGKEVVQYFQAEIDPATKRYLSEDYWFSARCREIGIKTWVYKGDVQI